MNLFDTLPGSFFNCLASGSSNRIYADCLLLIYHEYDREITYRIPRSQVRDALAVYLMEHLECTGVLIECGFLSNYEEAKRLQTDAYQKKLSAAICGAITEYLSEREERHEI